MISIQKLKLHLLHFENEKPDSMMDVNALDSMISRSINNIATLEIALFKHNDQYFTELRRS